jgi:predicted transcriptional regulator
MLSAKHTRMGIKTAAQKPVSDLPGNASRNDLIYRAYVRQEIDTGLKDIRAGRVLSHEALRKEFARPV